MPAKSQREWAGIIGRLAWFLGPGLLLAFASGCATLHPTAPAPPSFAFEHPEATRLGRAVAQAEQRHPGESGFGLLEYGLESLVARAALADAADQTIDAQYYIYDSDEAGSILAEHLLEAADRGVRVRLLLDDYNLGSDSELIALSVHPKIQVRVFNPTLFRPRWARLLEYALHFRRSTRRMHNKLFIVDNEFTILGGRNVGNDYFNVRANNIFRDFDVLIAGPATTQASAAFDQYWNSAWSIPAVALGMRTRTAADLEKLRHKLKARVKNAERFDEEYSETRGHDVTDLANDGQSLVWARGEVVTDPPQKIAGTSPETRPVAQRLDQEFARAKQEVLIEAAYFVPGRDGLEIFRQLRARGVSIRLVTSALETTDVPMVYCAYQKWRRDLVAAGVDLYEYKVHPAQERRDRKWPRLRPSYAALHSKVLVFDGQTAWIGSFNLDPRSHDLNTEVAVVVNSAALSAMLAESINNDRLPTRSWRIQLQPDPRPAADDRRGPPRQVVTWTGEANGEPVTLFHEPMSCGRRIEVFFLSMIPGIDDQL
ncbi:MAG TPA: phospholipase D family protein [Opitutaceae bacterium]|jgi:putative cardiolipin synthase|nr:phospholipase D family protein [Opitutaceae bacterium]